MSADLRQPASIMAALIDGVRDDQLSAPTPCGAISVAALLDHVDSLCVAFTAAAAKTVPAGTGGAPVPDASRLGEDWRTRLPARLDELAEAWRAEAAWSGTTRAGGSDMPAEAAGLAALDEVIVDGWDLAAGTGQTYPDTDPAMVDAMTAAYRWVSGIVTQYPQGSPGLFGPPVPVPERAPMLHRLLGLTGRDPAWRAGTAER